MNDEQLKDLMNYLASSNFVEFELEREGFKLRLVKQPVQAPESIRAPAPEGATAPMAYHPPAPAGPEAVESNGDIGTITSPMVGTFYRATNPNADPFVEVGDVVNQGQVVCIVEAMKLMNEIEADRAGEILDIPIANGQPVEFGETLFRIRST